MSDISSEQYPPVSNPKPWWQEALLTTFLVAITAIFTMVVFWKVYRGPGIGPGADTSSFAHTAKYTVDYFKDNHNFPPIDLAWYAGFEEQQAPPVITVVLGSIYYVTGDIERATRILTPVGIFLFFIIMFWFMKAEGYPTINAWMAGVAYAYTPTIFLTFGSYTKFMALMFLPPAFFFTNRILVHPQKLKYSALLALMIGLSIFSHPMNGFVFSFSLIMYALIYALLDNKIEFRRVFWVAISISTGFLFASNFVIPFVFEKAGRTAVPYEESTYIYSLKEIYSAVVSNIGGLFCLVYVFIAWRHRHPKIMALFITGLVTAIIVVLYLVVGLGKIFPFTLTYAYIWEMIVGFMGAYLLGSLLGFKESTLGRSAVKLVLAILVMTVFILFVNSQPFVNLKKLTANDTTTLTGDLDLAKTLQSVDNPGRVYATHYPFGFTNYIISGKTDKPSIEGHYYGISRISHQIAIMADAIHNQYYNYVFQKLNNLNTRYIVANSVLTQLVDPNGEFVGKKFISALTKDTNYKKIYSTPIDSQGSKKEWGASFKEDYQLYYRDEPSNYLVPIDDNILVIGKYGPTLAASVSNSNISMLEANSIYLDDYDVSFLQNFETVVLYGFGYHNRDKAEQIAKKYVKGGGNLVVELFGVGHSNIEENPKFLGVIGYNRKLTGDTKINILDTTYTAMLPNKLWLPSEIYDTGTGILQSVPIKSWNFLEYVNLDKKIASLPDENNLYSIFGYKNLPGGKVTFIGTNLFYHLYLTKDDKELKLISSLLNPHDTNGSTSGAPKDKLVSDNITISPMKLSFNVQNPKKRTAFVSIAHSKHWRAYINGKQIPVIALEDLVGVELPAGQYTLEVKYSTTVLKNISNVLTALTFVGLISLVVYLSIKERKNQHVR